MICTNCDQDKSLDEFYDKHHQCKDCYKIKYATRSKLRIRALQKLKERHEIEFKELFQEEIRNEIKRKKST